MVPVSRFPTPRRRAAAFVNRTEELGLVSSHLTTLAGDPDHLQVFEVIGLGGVGKTRLLNELQQRLADADRPSASVWVSLQSEAASSASGTLRVLRNQLPFNTVLFDVALLTYHTAIGQPLPRLGRSPSASLVMRSVELGGGLSGVPLPVSFAADIYGGLGRAAARRRRYTRDEFEEIDELRGDPDALFDHLPHYLGEDIQRHRQSPHHPLVYFYDGYDKQSHPTVTAAAPWLREFIASVGAGAHLITTRERLGWDDREWGDVLQPLILGVLPEDECRAMIQAAVGTVPADIVDRLVESSHQIPFFLQVSLDVLRAQIDERRHVKAEDLPSSPADAVEHLLDHLEPEERTLAVVLACLEYFDAPLYAHLVRDLNLGVSVIDMDEFVGWFFVQPEEHGLHKTHDLLTAEVRGSPRFESVRRQALAAATDHLAVRPVLDPGAADVVLRLFRSLLAAWTSVPSVPPTSTERLVDIGYALYDAGFWPALSSLAGGPQPDGHASGAVAELFGALTTRRTAGAGAALVRLEELEPHRDLLGRHAASFDLEVAYLSEISGNYERARQEFAELDERAVPFDPARRDHLRGRLYHADMMTMDGQLLDASRTLLDAYESLGPGSPLDWAELVRHRGHVHRFSFLFETAEQLYLQALEVVPTAPSMAAKLRTNLAEARCWFAAEAALEDAAEGIRQNAEVGNGIEIGKCLVASAIARARLGDHDRADDLSEQARRRFADLGYPAGDAFALQARAVAEAIDGADGDRPALTALAAAVTALGTYGHLCVAPAFLGGDTSAYETWSTPVGWLSPADLDDRIASVRPRE
jgi:tetratricopeptide (TPR) repeat protein